MAFIKNPLTYDELREIVEYSDDLETRVDDAFGDVIGTGTNADGTYIKYANGILECFKTLSSNGPTVSYQGQYISSAMSWQFPYAFYNEPPLVHYSIVSSESPAISVTRLASTPHTTTEINNIYVVLINTSVDINVKVSIRAIGRWK